MKKKKFFIGVVILFLWISVFSVDLIKAKTGKEPIFTAYFNSNSKNYYVGLFYVYKQDFSIAPSQPFEISGHVELAPWFLPGIEVYANRNR